MSENYSVFQSSSRMLRVQLLPCLVAGLGSLSACSQAADKTAHAAPAKPKATTAKQRAKSAALTPSTNAVFYGDDLTVVNQPYSLRLPTAPNCQVNWGDGAVEQITSTLASHIYKQPGSAAITVKIKQGNGQWAPVALDYAAQVATSHPALFKIGDIKPGTVLPKVLSALADSFSIECRVRLDNPNADQTIFASSSTSAGACQFGIKNQSLFFELAGSGAVSVPLKGQLSAGQWQHLAVTYDRSPLFPRSNQVHFFIDGQPAGDGTIAADDAGAISCRAATIGGPGFKGSIADLAVYASWLFPLVIYQHAQNLAGNKTLGVTIAQQGASSVTVDAPNIQRTVDVALDPNPQADNGPTLRKALAAATAGTRLRLVSQTNPGKGGVFYVRSLKEAPQWAALLVENKTDFELDGNGCTLMFSDAAARYMLVDQCQRVAIRNLSFDLDPTYARVGMYAKLLEVDPQTQTVKAQLVNGRTGKPDPVIPRRASYWRWRPHDPKTLRINKEGPYFNAGSYTEKPQADPASGPGVIRFRLKENANDKLWGELKAYQAGANFFLINNGDFSTNSVSLMHCHHVTFENDNYYATLGMVFLSSDFDHLHITHCKIGLPPGLTAADRPLASGADGYHFHLTQGDILFDHNEITLTDDDPISIKDSISPNVKKVSDNQLEIGSAKDKKPGTPIELLNPDYSETGYSAKVTSAAGKVLTLDTPLPAEVKEGSLIVDRTYHTQNWILRDNYLHDYYGRVMLYTDHGTVTDNRVHGSYYHLGNSTAYFETAGVCRNVITHRNLFEATNADSSNWGGNQSLPSFHEITYSDNSFLGKGLNLNNAANSVVVGNWFGGKEATLAINHSVDTQVQDNLSFQPGGTTFAVKTKDNTGVVIQGNICNGRSEPVH